MQGNAEARAGRGDQRAAEGKSAQEAEARDAEGEDDPSLASDLAAFGVFAFCVVPLIVVPLSFVFGAMLAAVEGWALMDGFYSVISNVLSMPNPLVTNTPSDEVGKVLDIVVSLWSIGVTGTVIAMVGSMSLVNRCVDSLHPLALGLLAAVRRRLGVQSKTKAATVDVAAFCFLVLILVPGFVLLLACLFAAMLMGVEDWSFTDSFYYVTSGICGLSNPLTSLTPESHGGKIFDIFVSIWSLSLSGAVIGAVGAFQLVDATIKRVEGRKVDFLEDAKDVEDAFGSSDRLGFDAFFAAINKGESTWPKHIARRAFEALDSDGSGDLDKVEGDRFVNLLNAIGELMTQGSETGESDMVFEIKSQR